MRRTKLKKKKPDRIKIAPRQCISWKTRGSVEEFCTNYQTGDTSESICIYVSFIYPIWTKCSDLNLTDFKLTINLNNFYRTVAFSGEQNLQRDYYLYLEKTGEVSYMCPISSCTRLKKKAPIYKLVRSPIWCSLIMIETIYFVQNGFASHNR